MGMQWAWALTLVMVVAWASQWATSERVTIKDIIEHCTPVLCVTTGHCFAVLCTVVFFDAPAHLYGAQLFSISDAHASDFPACPHALAWVHLFDCTVGAEIDEWLDALKRWRYMEREKQ